MQHRQRGMTMLGILVLVIVVGAWVYAGIRMAPKYLEFMRVASTLEQVRDEYDSNPGTTEFMLRKAVERRFDIEIKKDGAMFTMRAAYDDTVPLAGNVSFLLEFDKSVEVNAR